MPVEQYTPEFRPEPENYVLKPEHLAKPPYYRTESDLASKHNRLGPDQSTGSPLAKTLRLHPDLDEEIAAAEVSPAPSMADYVAGANPPENTSRMPLGTGLAPVDERSMAEQVAEANPPANMSPDPRGNLLRQALGGSVNEEEPYLRPHPDNRGENEPNVGISEDGSEVITESVHPEANLSIQDDLFHGMDVFDDIDPDNYSGMEDVERQRR
ncbi:unnamed protein product, partial [marine sediment metagenome]